MHQSRLPQWRERNLTLARVTFQLLREQSLVAGGVRKGFREVCLSCSCAALRVYLNRWLNKSISIKEWRGILRVKWWVGSSRMRKLCLEAEELEKKGFESHSVTPVGRRRA